MGPFRPNLARTSATEQWRLISIVCATQRKKNLVIASLLVIEKTLTSQFSSVASVEERDLFCLGDGKVWNCVKSLSSRSWAPVKSVCYWIKGGELDHKTSNWLRKPSLMNDQVGWKRNKIYITVNRQWSRPYHTSFPLTTEKQLCNCNQSTEGL